MKRDQEPKYKVQYQFIVKYRLKWDQINYNQITKICRKYWMKEL